MSLNYFKISKFFLLLPVLAVAIVTTSTLFPFIVGKYTWFRTSVDLALIFFLIGLTLGRPDLSEEVWGRFKSLWRKPLVLAVTAFVAAFLLAVFFGVNPSFSFWSNFERGEGGIQIIHLYVFFLLLITLFKEEDDWQRLLRWSIAGALLMVAYGTLAGLGVQGFIGSKFSEAGFRFSGSIGNPAYVAAYLIFAMFYCLYLLVNKYWRKFSSVGAVFIYFLLIIFLVFFLLAATRGAFVGLLASGFAFVFYLALSYKKFRKWFLILIGLMALAIFFLVNLRENPLVQKLPVSRILDISFSATTFKHRVIMWQLAIEGWKERPVFGWGPENFSEIFDRIFDTRYFRPSEGFGAWFDRAHNVFFDYLAETGIVGLLSFLSIFAVFYWQLLLRRARMRADKNADDRGGKNNRVFERSRLQESVLNALFFSVLAAYLVQGLALFDVFTIYINVFLFLALSVYRFQAQNVKKHE